MEEQDLPTLERKNIPELTEAGRKYREAVDERMKLQKEREIPLKKQVLDLMHANSIDSYKDESISIVLKPGEEKVKVKIGDADDDAPTE